MFKYPVVLWSILTSILLCFHRPLVAEDYIIYSIEQEVPMGYKEEVPKKNYYLNIGLNQGVKKGTFLDVVRIISKINPYGTSIRYNYKIKIGELEVIHSESDAAIAQMGSFVKGDKTPINEHQDFMIGDSLQVHID